MLVNQHRTQKVQQDLNKVIFNLLMKVVKKMKKMKIFINKKKIIINYLNKPIKEKYLNIDKVMKYYKTKMEKLYQWYWQNKVLFHHKIGNMILI